MRTIHDRVLAELAQGEVLSLRGTQGTGIAVSSGRIWLTQTRDPRDVILRGGERFRVNRSGMVVVEALEIANVRICESRRDARRRNTPSMSDELDDTAELGSEAR